MNRTIFENSHKGIGDSFIGAFFVLPLLKIEKNIMNKDIVEQGKATQFQSGSEAALHGREGGKASGKARREKRLLSEICEMIGKQKSDSPLLEGLPEDERTKDAEVIAAQYLAAQAGDTKAATFLRDTKGESKVQVELAKAEPIDMSKLGFSE